MRHQENNTQFAVKLCLSCNHAWEKDAGKTIIHLGFPKYALRKKTCGICAKKEQLQLIQSRKSDELENVEFDNRRDTL